MSLDGWKGAVSNLQGHTVPAAFLGWVAAGGRRWRFLLQPSPLHEGGGRVPARTPGAGTSSAWSLFFPWTDGGCCCAVFLFTALALHFWVNFGEYSSISHPFSSWISAHVYGIPCMNSGFSSEPLLPSEPLWTCPTLHTCATDSSFKLGFSLYFPPS